MPPSISPFRKEFLKGYIMALFAEGQFSGARSPAVMFSKAMAALAEDVPAVLGDLSATMIDQATEHMVGIGADKIREFVKDVGKRGLKASWSDIMAQYRRGVENKHGKRQ